MSEEAQAARVKSMIEDLAVLVLGDQVHEVDTSNTPLSELFDSLAFMQFKAELTCALPVAKDALDFAPKEEPTMDLVVKKIMQAIAKAAKEGVKPDNTQGHRGKAGEIRKPRRKNGKCGSFYVCFVGGGRGCICFWYRRTGSMAFLVHIYMHMFPC